MPRLRASSPSVRARWAPGLVLATLVLLAAAALTPPGAASAAWTGDSARGPAPRSQAAASAVPGVTLKPALKRLLARVNSARERHGRKPLRATVCLTTKVAQPWARHMAATENMVHQDMSVLFETCPGLTRVGENIAMGYPTPRAVMKGWMSSEGHRRNILDKRFRKIGLGLARTADGTPYWVQDFGR